MFRNFEKVGARMKNETKLLNCPFCKDGQIYKIHSDFYYVNSSNESYECKLREVLKKQKQKVYVGDFVEFEKGAIEKILPRKNFITRPTVANIDQVIIISAVKEPE